MLFEHDIYFQSIARRLPFITNTVEKMQARWEYLRALRYELRMLPAPDRIQVCSRDNREYIASFLPALKDRIDDGYPRRHRNLALRFQASRPRAVHPAVPRQLPPSAESGSAHLVPARSFSQSSCRGAARAPGHHRFRSSRSPFPARSRSDRLDRIRRRRARASQTLFVVRVPDPQRLRRARETSRSICRRDSRGLNASWRRRTRRKRWRLCALADDAPSFAAHIVKLLRDPESAAQMAERARAEVSSPHARHARHDRAFSRMLSRRNQAACEPLITSSANHAIQFLNHRRRPSRAQRIHHRAIIPERSLAPSGEPAP